MRRLVDNAESDRHEAVVKSTQLIEKKSSMETLPVHKPIQVFDPQAEKINNLEREQLKLTATQTLAEVCVLIFICCHFSTIIKH